MEPRGRVRQLIFSITKGAMAKGLAAPGDKFTSASVCNPDGASFGGAQRRRSAVGRHHRIIQDPLWYTSSPSYPGLDSVGVENGVYRHMDHVP